MAPVVGKLWRYGVRLVTSSEIVSVYTVEHHTFGGDSRGTFVMRYDYRPRRKVGRRMESLKEWLRFGLCHSGSVGVDRGPFPDHPLGICPGCTQVYRIVNGLGADITDLKARPR